MGHFPGSMVKNPPCNAGGMGSIPGWEAKIPHAPGQLCLCTTTTKIKHHNQSPFAAMKVHTMQQRFHLPQPSPDPVNVVFFFF